MQIISRLDRENRWRELGSRMAGRLKFEWTPNDFKKSPKSKSKKKSLIIFRRKKSLSVENPGNNMNQDEALLSKSYQIYSRTLEEHHSTIA